MAESHVRQETIDGTLVLTLARPEKLNAFTWDMLDDLLALMRQGEADANVRAILVRGEGRAFCTGFDLSAIAADAGKSSYQGPQTDQLSFQRAAAYWRAVWQIRKPVIAAVHGYCMAGGMEFVMHADFAIAADDAMFGYPAVRASGLPDTHMFIYHIGPQWTRRLLMTGDTIDAATAERIGLVLETVPRAELEDRALALARAVAQAPQPILAAVKGVVNQSIELMGYTALQRENWSQSAMARAAPEIQEFDQIVRESGLKAALAWRDRKTLADPEGGENP